ncbi:MAG: hypothetical protein AAFZ18_19110 [Myxococcota bacterium]
MFRCALTLGLAATFLLAPDASARAGDKKKKDRGEATMTVGGEPWTASSARFKIKKGALRLSMSKSSKAGDVRRRESLTLVIGDYSGPGTYTSPRGSTFTRVALNPKKVEAQSKEPGGDAKVLSRLLNKATAWMLTDAQVTVTKASPTEVVGTFRWAPGALPGERIEQGRFRAVIRTPRKKMGSKPPG